MERSPALERVVEAAEDAIVEEAVQSFVEPVDARDVLHDFMAVMHRQRLFLHRAFAQQEMHPAQGQCLRVLGRFGPVGMTQSELAEIMMLSRPSITRILQRLERAGLVHRHPDPDDQRHTRVGLTDEGSLRNDRLGDVLAEYTGATLARLSENDRRQLSRLLRTWRELADEVLAKQAGADGSPAAADDATHHPPEGSTA
jgi:MarR family transcriptional regulator, organic hydroperoxide resistance regulator